MVSFHCSKPLTNSHMKLLAQSCDMLDNLNLGLKEQCDFYRDFDFDFDDDGLCALANSCRNLCKVQLTYRLHVGDVGVESLVRSCKNLTVLNLSGCVNVTDELLKVIGEECYLHDLVLDGCYLITDLGLKYLMNGDLKYHLGTLDLGECDKISDDGIRCLKDIVNLKNLNLCECGNNVADFGIVDLLSEQPNIKILDLSWLKNISDVSLSVIGSKCLKLESIIWFVVRL